MYDKRALDIAGWKKERYQWVPEGYQVKRIRRPHKTAPSWVYNEKQVLERIYGEARLLHKIAFLYWRLNYSANEVAAELSISKTLVKSALKRLKDT